MKALFTVIILSASLYNPLNEVFEDLTAIIKHGKVEQLNSYLAAKVELSILDEDDTYSKQQAQQILKDFFAKNKPTDFIIIHKGKSGDLQYAIGTLTTESKIFRVNIYVKSSGGKYFIQQFSVDEEDEE